MELLFLVLIVILILAYISHLVYIIFSKKQMKNYNFYRTLKESGGILKFGRRSYLILNRNPDNVLRAKVVVEINSVIVEEKEFQFIPLHSSERVSFKKPWRKDIEVATKINYKILKRKEREVKRRKKEIERKEYLKNRELYNKIEGE